MATAMTGGERGRSSRATRPGARAALTRQVAELTTLALRTVDAVPARELAAVDRALGQARATLEAIKARAGAAGADEPSSSVGVDTMFEATDAPGRAVTAAELSRAEADWAEALDRGYRHRALVEATAGPLLTPGEAASRLGVSTVTVNNWRLRGRLLGLRLDRHQYRYPAFQFADSPAAGEAGVVRGVEELLALLGERDAWSTVQLLLTPDPFLDGRRPIDVLRAGGGDAPDRLRRWAAGAGELGG